MLPATYLSKISIHYDHILIKLGSQQLILVVQRRFLIVLN